MEPDPSKTRKGEDPSARDRLLRSALDLFDKKGYAVTTVREIVEAAGVTKPVLYFHFGSKEGLYLALFGNAFSALQSMLAQASEAPGTARERVLNLCDRVYAFHRENLPLVRIMYSIYYGPPQGSPPFDFDATHQEFQAVARRIIHGGIERGEIRAMSLEDALWAVVGALNIAMELDLCHPEQSLGRGGLKRILNAVFDGIGMSNDANQGVLP